MSKICSSCNAENVDEAKFCRKCGTSQFYTEHNLEEKDLSEKLSSKDIDDILNGKNRIKKHPEIIEKLILEFDKQFRKCIAQRVLPSNYIIASNIVRDRELNKDYVTSIDYPQLWLKENDRYVDAYEIDEQTYKSCFNKAYDLTGTYLSERNTGWATFFSVITMFSLIAIFRSDYAVGSFLFFGVILFITIMTHVFIEKTNSKTSKLFDIELDKFTTNNYFVSNGK